jgi:hypothetical protein
LTDSATIVRVVWADETIQEYRRSANRMIKFSLRSGGEGVNRNEHGTASQDRSVEMNFPSASAVGFDSSVKIKPTKGNRTYVS